MATSIAPDIPPARDPLEYASPFAVLFGVVFSVAWGMGAPFWLALEVLWRVPTALILLIGALLFRYDDV